MAKSRRNKRVHVRDGAAQIVHHVDRLVWVGRKHVAARSVHREPALGAFDAAADVPISNELRHNALGARVTRGLLARHLGADCLDYTVQADGGWRMVPAARGADRFGD